MGSWSRLLDVDGQCISHCATWLHWFDPINGVTGVGDTPVKRQGSTYNGENPKGTVRDDFHFYLYILHFFRMNLEST